MLERASKHRMHKLDTSVQNTEVYKLECQASACTTVSAGDEIRQCPTSLLSTLAYDGDVTLGLCLLSRKHITKKKKTATELLVSKVSL